MLRYRAAEFPAAFGLYEHYMIATYLFMDITFDSRGAQKAHVISKGGAGKNENDYIFAYLKRENKYKDGRVVYKGDMESVGQVEIHNNGST
ncbi:hypothetical protein POVCU2_0019460 [Plasmodium ovale curtisi]|uniref:Uncharacterized protein n=1 Tax=Plasmodium ovale curtisi TaxID=864141 RepID=A0A1A8VRP6_PLAOA|nr:hypothetical protein POVCU2_0019460 [Plasmodium ovale curtisi]SBS90032.1 hypothetical protein POVCU1_017430 [Plasmodium ovale curtisi]